MRDALKRLIDFFRNTDIDIRVRLLFLIEYAALVACLTGTATMLMFTTTIYMLIPNFILLVLCITGLLLSHIKKNYEVAANLIIIGCAYISLPMMFFTAGGNRSGMVVWFVFGVVFCCFISKGRARFIMPAIMIVIAGACMLIGYYHPEYVVSLENQSAEFFDTLQSFFIVTLMLLGTFCAFFYTYDRQSKKLKEQSDELRRIALTDSLTGLANRHAFYEDTNDYKDMPAVENLVLIAMDVNGLKRVNDTDGHASGDAFIKCAADVMDAAYGKLGKVYRTGGDEFIAILFCDDEKLDQLKELLNDAIKASTDEMSQDMSIALGIAAWNREKDKTFFELEKLADSRMYQNKSEYYKKSDVDRRKA